MPRPKKRLGQHFLHARAVIDRIVDAIAPAPGEHLVEIGPGLGALTEPLLERGARLDVVELDRDLIGGLEGLAAHSDGRLRVHHADALDFDVCTVATAGAVRVAGNLPYNISTPLIFHLLAQRRCIRDMHFMLQRELVERMASEPGGKDYGRLSIMTQYHCEVDALFTIGPEAFRPPPKVDSAIVRLAPRPRPPTTVEADPVAFEQVVRHAFAQRRKTLRNALRGLLTEEGFEAAGVDPRLRAERLTIDDFARLALQLPPGSNDA